MNAPAYRLALVTDATVQGGAERVLAHLAAALPADVSVVVIGPHAPTVHAVAAARPGALAVVAPMRVGALRRAFVTHDVDVVHVNLTSFVACRAAPWAGVIARRPVVLLDHGPTPGLRWRGRLRQRLLSRLVAARVAVGAAAARDAERWGGLRAGSVRITRNAVPGPPTPFARGGPTLPVVLGVLARLSPEKGVDVLLRALASVPDAFLLVAGDGPERTTLEKSVATLGLGHRVSFLGWQPDASEVLACVDVVVVPSRSEGLPLVALEAMHAGRPVVASDVGSVSEAVRDGETGLLVPPEDPAALARALRRVVTDGALRSRLGARGAEVARAEFSMSAMAAAYDGLYRSFARADRRRTPADRGVAR